MARKDSDLAKMLVEDMDKDEGSEVDSDEEEMGDTEVAAQEVLDAISSGDAAELAASMKAFVKLCKYEKESEEED
jgi:hypothetical protein